jgi:phytoene synthase
MTDTDHRAIIRQSVRAHDHDRYLATLFAPEPARDALMALYAFGADVARIPEAVSEPMMGEIRLQWWRDALDTVERGERTGNPVADGLGAAMRDYALPKPILVSVIDARAFDLSGGAMPDMPALQAYLQKTAGNLFALAARIVAGGAHDSDADRAAREAGQAWGLTGLLRALPVHIAHGRLYLPERHFRERGADPRALFSGEADDKARAALAALRSEAGEAFGQARAAVADLDSARRIVFLPLALVPPYLTALEKNARKPLETVADIGPLRRICRLGWAAARGRV